MFYAGIAMIVIGFFMVTASSIKERDRLERRIAFQNEMINYGRWFTNSAGEKTYTMSYAPIDKNDPGPPH